MYQKNSQAEHPKSDRQRQIADLIAQAADADVHLTTADELRLQIIADATAKDFAGWSK